MLCIIYVAAFVCTGWGGLLLNHYLKYEVFNLLQASLSLFLVINLMICLWEIVLFFYIEDIQNIFKAKKKKIPNGEFGNFFLIEEASLTEVCTPSFWANIWATYSLFDPSYSDTRSFGWCIDIGNGFSTLPPTVAFAIGMTEPFVSARVLGIIGILSFYQEFYGTVIYFTQYIINKQWQHHNNPLYQRLLLVFTSNVIWMVFPGIGIYASYNMIIDNDYSMFH